MSLCNLKRIWVAYHYKIMFGPPRSKRRSSKTRLRKKTRRKSRSRSRSKKRRSKKRYGKYVRKRSTSRKRKIKKKRPRGGVASLVRALATNTSYPTRYHSPPLSRSVSYTPSLLDTAIFPSLAYPGSDESDKDEDELVRSMSSLSLEVKEDTKTEDASLVCSICTEHKKCILYTPCNHIASCNTCAQQILKSGNKKCPLCRKPIEKLTNVFF